MPHVSRLPFLPIRVRGIFSYLLAMKWIIYIPMYHQLSNSGDSASEYCERPGLRSQCDPSRQPVPSGACVWDFARFPVVDYYIQKAETIVRYTDLRFSGDGCNRSWFDLTIHFDCGHMSLVPPRCAPDHRRSHVSCGISSWAAPHRALAPVARLGPRG